MALRDINPQAPVHVLVVCTLHTKSPLAAGRPRCFSSLCLLLWCLCRSRLVARSPQVVCLIVLDAYPSHVISYTITWQIPKLRLSGLEEARPSHTLLLGHLLQGARAAANASGLSTSGYRVVVNQGAEGGQSVQYLHLHVLGGRPLSWPPG